MFATTAKGICNRKTRSLFFFLNNQIFLYNVDLLSPLKQSKNYTIKLVVFQFLSSCMCCDVCTFCISLVRCRKLGGGCVYFRRKTLDTTLKLKENL